VEFLEEHALELGLHRLEAGTMVDNVPSRRVLEACGYEQYGMAPKLLHLNGAWRDHVLFQKLLHDRPLGG
jgi:ribosomal-protein-alanine N-acetyltransferase